MPQNRMSRFDLLIGVWNTTGEVHATEANAAGHLVATDTYVMGYDRAKRHHFARSHDDMGTSEVFVVELSGRRWTISGEKLRFKGSFNSPKNRLSGQWEMKKHKGGWDPWIELELVRA